MIETKNNWTKESLWALYLDVEYDDDGRDSLYRNSWGVDPRECFRFFAYWTNEMLDTLIDVYGFDYPEELAVAMCDPDTLWDWYAHTDLPLTIVDPDTFSKKLGAFNDRIE